MSDQHRIAQGVLRAELREADEAEIVDQDDDRSARGWCHVVQRMDHVDGAGPSFDARLRRVALPEGADDLRGEWSCPWANPLRHRRGEIGAAAPAERVRARFDVVAPGQRAQQSPRHFTDARAVAEERCAVKSDAKGGDSVNLPVATCTDAFVDDRIDVARHHGGSSTRWGTDAYEVLDHRDRSRVDTRS